MEADGLGESPAGPQRSPQAVQGWGFWDIPGISAGVGSRLDSGALTTCSHLAGLLLHCGVELLSCSSLGRCVGASHHPGKFPPFHARPMCCSASSGLFFPCVVKQKQKLSAKMFFAHRAHPICANSSFNTPSFYCKSVAAGEHEGSRCGRGWQIPDPWQQGPRTP